MTPDELAELGAVLLHCVAFVLGYVAGFYLYQWYDRWRAARRPGKGWWKR